jgi:hypothetical protein
LQFQVTQAGRIKNLKTIHSHPPKMMDFQIRRSMRLAVFRPSLTDGRAQTVDNYTYTYEFPYLPSAPAKAPPEPTQDEPDTESTQSTKR